LSKLEPQLISTLKGYSKDQFLKDVIAGVVVAVIALPLSIALAISSGVSPEKGLYTAIVAGFFISLLGGSRVQIGGPTGAFMIVVYGIVAEFGMEGLTLATLMAGAMMILMGLLRFGSVIKYIPYPITTGFTGGIALVIFSSQIKDFFGLKIDSVPADFIGKWQSYFNASGTMHLQTTAIGVLALLIIILWPKINRKIPGALIALIVTSLIVKFFGLTEVETIGSRFGTLASSLPVPTLPNFSLSEMRLLLPAAFSIAVLGSIESLLSAVVSDGMIGEKHRSNMELIAQGVANGMSAIFGGIPATGAIARTVANINNGGRTPVAGMVHALTLLVILMALMPLAKLIPLASLAAVLIIVAYNMSEWRAFQRLFRAPKSDVAVLLTTFLITVLVDLIMAIEVGIVLASFLFMRRMIEVSNIGVGNLDFSEEQTPGLGRGKDSDEKVESERTSIAVTGRIKHYEINGPFFFGAADKFLDVLGELGVTTEYLIVGMTNVPIIDATALHAFRRMIETCKKKHIQIILAGVGDQPLKALKKVGFYAEVKLFATAEEALEYARARVSA